MRRSRLSRKSSKAQSVRMKRLSDETLVQVREMTPAELASEGWEEKKFGGKPLVLVFANGMKIYASSDEEGNDYGALFGETSKGKKFFVKPTK